MKISKFLGALCATLLFFSCSSDIEENIPTESDKKLIEVGFNLCGDFIDINNSPITKTSDHNSKTYYYFQIWKYIDPDHFLGGLQNYGHIGLFDNLGKAKVYLESNQVYTIKVTALVEYADSIDLKKLSEIEATEHSSIHYGSMDTSYVNVFNRFSEYLTSSGNSQFHYPNIIETPTYPHKNIDRYYNSKEVYIYDQKQIDIELQRFSYCLKTEIDAPQTGSVVLSCNKPVFKYTVSANDPHFSSSKIYGIGETDLSAAQDVITLKLEYFDKDHQSTQILTKEINVKANVETTVNVKTNEHAPKNQFNITLDKTPMKKESVNF